MAGSRFAYVKDYELADPLLPGTFILARIDGRGFHRFSQEHAFAKPYDERALDLMDQAARGVMSEFKDIILAFGESDEFSFLFRKATSLYNRRMSKILTALTSTFTSRYMFHWAEYFPETPLRYPPSFDGRIVLYPTEKEVRDYFSWRQTDTHINNLYNTAFWALVQQGGQSTTEAHATLRGTVSSQKHELLFRRFDINYNSLPDRLRKGTLLVREKVYPDSMSTSRSDEARDAISAGDLEMIASTTDTGPPAGHLADASVSKSKIKASKIIVSVHRDIIADDFWVEHPNLLSE